MVVLFDWARSFGRDAHGVVREEGDTRLASQIRRINPGDQWGDRCHNQVALTSRTWVQSLVRELRSHLPRRNWAQTRVEQSASRNERSRCNTPTSPRAPTKTWCSQTKTRNVKKKKKKKTETNLTTNRVYDRASGTELAFSTLGLQSQPVQILPSFSVLRAQALTLVLCLPWVLSPLPTAEWWGSQAPDLSWAPTPTSALWTPRLTQQSTNTVLQVSPEYLWARHGVPDAVKVIQYGQGGSG